MVLKKLTCHAEKKVRASSCLPLPLAWIAAAWIAAAWIAAAWIPAAWIAAAWIPLGWISAAGIPAAWIPRAWKEIKNNFVLICKMRLRSNSILLTQSTDQDHSCRP